MRSSAPVVVLPQTSAPSGESDAGHMALGCAAHVFMTAMPMACFERRTHTFADSRPNETPERRYESSSTPPMAKTQQSPRNLRRRDANAGPVD